VKTRHERRIIEDFPDYEVSNFGGVIYNIHTKHPVSPSKTPTGAWKINLMNDHVVYTRSVAKIVCLTFHGVPEKGMVVIHKDENYDNLDADNLMWRPRWYAQERAIQRARVYPLRDIPIRVNATGEVYPNSRACADALYAIERYIVLAAGQGENGYYMGSTYTYIYD
jgi:hypothetical protein